MRTPVLVCSACGSSSIRRSKRQSLLEALKMTLGIYPFRCMDCGNRYWVSVWLLSKLAYAKCPRCLSSDLTLWPERYFAPKLWRNLMIAFGAHRYRCHPCRHNFISFRPRLVSPGEQNSPPSTSPVAKNQGATSLPVTE